MARCNLTPEERAKAFGMFPEALRREEEEQIEYYLRKYLFYETDGKNTRYCHCTACHRETLVHRCYIPDFFQKHHNDTAYCPDCGAEVQLKSLGKMSKWYAHSKSLRRTDAVTIIRTSPDGALLIDCGLAEVNYHRDYLEPELDWHSKARYYIAPGKVQMWHRPVYFSMLEAFYGVDAGEWEVNKNICKPFHANGMYGYDDTYYLIGVENIAGSQLKYSQLEEWWMEETGTDINDPDRRYCFIPEYLGEYAMIPQIEMLVKFGLTKAVTERLEGNANSRDINWKAKTPDKLLRLSKGEAKEFLKDPSMELLRSYHAAVKAGTRCSMRQLMELRGWYSAVGTENIAYCARACGIDVFKAHRYVHKHSDLTKQTHNQVAGIWKDYLDLAQKLNYDMSREDVVMPKDPFKRHDEAAANYGAIEQEIKDKLYTRRYRELEKKYAFSMGWYSIVVPKTAEQIIEEGKTLKICVGGYAARHIEGGTTILFLRKTRKTGTSYVCIEMGTGLDDWKIKQIHGYRNEWYTGAVSPKVRHAEFINTWLEWVRNGSQRDKQGNPIIKERKTA